MTSDRPRTENWLSYFVRRLQERAVPADVTAHLVELHGIVADLTRTQAEHQAALEELREAVERMERQLTRAGKEQFKANTLAETQRQQVGAVMERLRDADAYRERELAQLRERLAELRSEGRLDIIKSVLPVLDGLDEAFASGERLLARATQAPEAAPSPERFTLFQRVRFAVRVLTTFTPFESPSRSIEPLSPRALSAWLDGLRFVQERLLDTLAAEGVHPIDTGEAVFDPHRHVAVETVAASDEIALDTIVRETRRGYMMGETVLRYAEVVVARAAHESALS